MICRWSALNRGTRLTNSTSIPTSIGYSLSEYKYVLESGEEISIGKGNYSIKAVNTIYDDLYKRGDYDTHNHFDSNSVGVIDVYYNIVTLKVTIDLGYECQGRFTDYDIQYNQKFPRPNEDPKRFGYTFVKWVNPNGEEFDFDAVILEPTTVKAIWSANEYVLTLDANGGEIDGHSSKAIDVTFDEYYLIDEPFRSGYSFKGWYMGEERVALDGGKLLYVYDSDITLVASWGENTYILTVNFNNGSDEKRTYYFDFDEAYDISDLAIEYPGYTFVDFVYDGNPFPRKGVWDYAHDVTIDAVWDNNDYMIHFDSNGGDNLDDLGVGYDEDFVLPTPERKGYTFLGWYDLYSQVDKIESGVYKRTGDMWLIAHWEANTYKITLDLGGGTLKNYPSNVIEVTFDIAYSIPDVTEVEKLGYDFLYWELDGEEYSPGVTYGLDHDITLTAKYSAPHTHIISYDADGGVDGNGRSTFDLSVAFGSKFAHPTVTRTG